MALPSASSTPSALSASDINIENGFAATQQMSFDDAIVRSLAGAPGTGTTISMAVLRGKAGPKSVSAAAPIQNLNIYNTVIATGWPGVPTVTYTIPSGTYIYSDSITLPALTTGGPFPGGLTIVNNGYIMGKGGTGSYGGTSSTGTGPFIAGSAGGNAISIDSASVTLINNALGWIGGGGGGGGGGFSPPSQIFHGGGGGAGGGNGGQGDAGGAIGTGATGGGRSPTSVGTKPAGGGRGTRQFVLNAQAGGNGAYSGFGGSPGAGGVNDGVGGGGTNPGGPKGPFNVSAAGGGGWGATGGTGGYNTIPRGAGTVNNGYAGGKAIALNGQTLTQTNTGTIWGAVS